MGRGLLFPCVLPWEKFTKNGKKPLKFLSFDYIIKEKSGRDAPQRRKEAYEKMLTDKELAAVPEELLEDLLRYSEYGWRERRIATLLARRYPVALTEADVRKLRRLGQKKLRQA